MTKNVITDVLFKGRLNEWWCLKEGAVVVGGASQTSHSHMYTINNNIALVIACNVLLVDKQEI